MKDRKKILEIKKLEKKVIRMSKEGLHSVTIAARTGFPAYVVREIIKEEIEKRKDKEVSI